MFQSKNCGHGFDLYIKVPIYPLTRETERMDELEELIGNIYVMFYPQYCPMCGKKIEGDK